MRLCSRSQCTSTARSAARQRDPTELRLRCEFILFRFSFDSSILRIFDADRRPVQREGTASQTHLAERCISVSASGLVATYPSIQPVSEPAGEAPASTVASLFDLHSSGLYRMALAMLREPSAAQDVVQDTFARLIVQIQTHGPLTQPRGWLYTVAAHACRDRQRRLRRWLPWTRDGDARRANETPDRFDDTQVVLYAIRALGSRDRLLIALRSQGLSYKEIGEAAGVHPASVGRLLARALDRLQMELDRRN